MNNKANLYIALGLLPLLGRRGSMAKTTPVPLRITGTPIDPKDPKAKLERYMNRLNVPKEQKLVRQKAIHNLPKDAKGRILKSDLVNLFSEELPYSMTVLSEPVSSVNVVLNSPLLLAVTQGKKLLQPKFMGQYEGMEHNLLAAYGSYINGLDEDEGYGRLPYQYNTKSDLPNQKSRSSYMEAIQSGNMSTYLSGLQQQEEPQSQSPGALYIPPFFDPLQQRRIQMTTLMRQYNRIFRNLFKQNLYTKDPEKPYPDYNPKKNLPELISNLRFQMRNIFGGNPFEKLYRSNLKFSIISKVLTAMHAAAPDYGDINNSFIKDSLKLADLKKSTKKSSRIYQDLLQVLPHTGTYSTPKGVLETVKFGGYGLSSIINFKKSFSKIHISKITEIEGLLYPKLREMLQNPVFAGAIGHDLADHFISIDNKGDKPLFWFRGLIAGETLYVQEMQSDHAQSIRKHSANNWSRQGRASKTVPFNWRLDRKTGLSYTVTTREEYENLDDRHMVMTFEQYINDEIELGVDEFGRELTAEEKEEMRQEMLRDGIKNYDKPKTKIPPSDWVRSDILMAFSLAACLGLRKVGFCSAAASIATVGGKPPGQREFYDRIVPARVQSIAQKYGMKQTRTKRLYFTKGALEIYRSKIDDHNRALGKPVYNPQLGETKLSASEKDLYAQVWDMGSAFDFFRQNGYPIFG
jgi:hypothetical protein